MPLTLRLFENLKAWESDPLVKAWIKNSRLYVQNWVSPGYKKEFETNMAALGFWRKIFKDETICRRLLQMSHLMGKYGGNGFNDHK